MLYIFINLLLTKKKALLLIVLLVSILSSIFIAFINLGSIKAFKDAIYPHYTTIKNNIKNSIIINIVILPA